MTFLAPVWLVVGMLALVVLALHVRKRRLIDVPSILLWRLLDPPSAPRPMIKPPPLTILLILQLLIVILAALALARPLFGLGPVPEHRIYLIDISASMRATDVAPSRFDAAMADLRRRIAATPGDGSRASVISVGPDPIVHVARQTDPDGMLPLLDRLVAGDGAADWAAAAERVASVRMAGEATHIFVLTDGADAAAAEAIAGSGIPADRIVFATASLRNAGVAAELTAVDAAAGAWRLGGAVSSSEGAGATTLAVHFLPAGGDGFLNWAEVSVALAADGRGAFALELALPGPGAIRLSLPADAWAADNTLQFVVAGANPVRVLQVGAANNAVARAIEAAGPAEIYVADGLPETDADFDLVVVDGVALDRLPATNSLLLNGAYVRGGQAPGALPALLPTAWRSNHPLSADIAWGALAATDGFLLPPMMGGDAIVEAGVVPLLEARTTAAGREVRINLAIGDAGWVDHPIFPLLLRNFVGWLGIEAGTGARACIVGRDCPVEARLIGDEIVAIGDSAVAAAVAARDPASGPMFVPARAGLYRVGTGLIAVNPAQGETVEPVLEGTAGPALPAAFQKEIWWWLLLAILVLLAIEGWIAGRGPERFLLRIGLAKGNPLSGRHRLLLALRLGAIAFVVIALLAVPLPGREQAEDLVLIAAPSLDGRRETGAGILAETGMDLAEARDGARAGLIAVGTEPNVAADLAPLAALETATAGTEPTGANVAQALRLAAAMLPADRPGHIVYAAGGQPADGRLADALPQLEGRDLTVAVAPDLGFPDGEIQLAAVTAPPRVRAGDSFPIQASIFTGIDRTARVTIFRDGTPIVETEVNLLRGTNRVDATIPDAVAGRTTIEVAVAADGDIHAINNRAGVIVEIDAAPAIAIVTPDLAWGQYFADALALQNLEAEILLPAAAPWELAGWMAYDSIILMNTPALDLNTVQQEQLEQAVEVHGRSLFILGGENSFGPGGYYETALERLSPLSSRIPRDAPHSAIVFVIDRSGSMQALAGGGSRLDIAKAATIRAIELLQDDTDVSVVVFDSMAYVVLPLQPKSEAAAAVEAIETLQAGGGTALQPALLQALAQLDGSDASVRHIVVMTDGLSEPGDFFAALQRARSASITISAVAIGQGADEALLRQIANIGGGNFSSTRDFAALPSILSREALLLAGSPVRNRASAVAWLDAAAPFAAGLPQEFPPIRTFVVTSAKPDADVHLGVADIDDTIAPLLASWRYGSGKVVAFTAHGAGPGTRDWMTLPEYPRLWAQIVRHFLPEAAGPGLHVQMGRDGDGLVVTAHVVGDAGEAVAGETVTAALSRDGGTPVELALTETAPGRYEARVERVEPGVHAVVVNAGERTGAAAVLISYPRRYDFAAANPAMIERLAAATGGTVLSGGERVFISTPVWVARAGWWLWLLIALSLFTLDLTVRHAPGLLGLARRAKPPRTTLAGAV